MKTLFVAMTLLFILSANCFSDTLSIRLVEAYNSKSEKNSFPSGLQDVSELLKSNLPYKNFSLLGTATTALPAPTPITISNYTLTIRGTTKLLVVVKQNNRDIFQSAVNLKPSSPVIVGGFQGKRGKILFIFNLQ